MRSLADGHARIRMFIFITGHVVGTSWEVTRIHQRLRQLEVGELRIYQRMRSIGVVATLECDGVISIRRKSELTTCRELLAGHNLRVPRLTVCRLLDETAEEELSAGATVTGRWLGISLA